MTPNLVSEICKGIITLSSVLSGVLMMVFSPFHCLSSQFLCIVFALFAVYHTNYQMAVVSNIIFEGSSFLRTHLLLPFVLEFVALVVHIPVYVNFEITSYGVQHLGATLFAGH
jgi:hypothetical protein